MIIDHSADVNREIEELMLKALHSIQPEAAHDCAEQLEESPRRVDTGNLKNHVEATVDKDKMLLYVGTNVEYAPYVYYGTPKMAPNKFLKNGLQNNKQKYIDIAKDVFGR